MRSVRPALYAGMTTTILGADTSGHPGWRVRALEARPCSRGARRMSPRAAYRHELIAETSLPPSRRPGTGGVERLEPAAVPALGHDQRQRHRRRGQLMDDQPGSLQQIDEGASREKAQVRAAQDAAVRIVEAAREELQSDPQVRDV